MSTVSKELQFFQEIVHYIETLEQSEPVSEIIPIDELWDKIDLTLTNEGVEDNSLYSTLKDIIKHTPKTASNQFFNQLFGGRQPKAVLGEWITALLNISMYTYKVGGPHIGIEKEILDKSIELLGYPETAGGTMPAGGSMSNFQSLVMARDWKAPDVKMQGINAPLVAYVSKASHYSHKKNASFCGIGIQNLRLVPVDENDCMDCNALASLIEEDLANGKVPFYVGATAGTTVKAAFDNVKDIRTVCDKFNIWMHIDGAYCGTVLFSSKYKHILEGAHLADSFSYNAHKSFGTPLTCSVLLVKEKQHLYNSFNCDADYLYQGNIDDFNPGKISFQCGRKNDALKFWTLWKSIGSKGLEKMIDHQFEIAEEARNFIKEDDDFELISDNTSPAVCFKFKHIESKELCKVLNHNGLAMVGYGGPKDDEFVRLVTVNSNINYSDVTELFDKIKQLHQEAITVAP